MSDAPDDSVGLVRWRDLWAQATEALGDRAAARWVCETAGAFDGDELLTSLDDYATERMVAHLDSIVGRHRSGEPLQYALGRWGFRHLDVMVDRRVLIPRPETELLVDCALDIARRRLAEAAEHLTIADLGTGSGVIGLSLAGELPVGSATVWLTDVSEDALDVARANAAGAGRAASSVQLAAGHWFGALPDELRGSLDLVVSNPPYIATDDAELDESVRDWEPHLALFAGADGLDAVREIVTAVPEWLGPDGWIVLEIGRSQGDAVADLLRAAGFEDVEIRRDLAGHPRMALGRL